MDELQDYELHLLLENVGFSYKNEWDMARLQSYCALSSFGKPKKTFDKFFPLPMDKNNDYEEHNTIVTEEDKEKIEYNKNRILEHINGRTNTNKGN